MDSECLGNRVSDSLSGPSSFVPNPKDNSSLQSGVREISSSLGRNLEAAGKRSNNNGRRSRARVLQSPFCGTKSHWGMETGAGRLHSQSVHRQGNILHGDAQLSFGSSETGRLSHVHRHEGRVLSHSHAPGFDEVPALHVPRKGLPIQSSAVRSNYSPLGVFKGGDIHRQDTEIEGSEDTPIFGRLANPSRQLCSSFESQNITPTVGRETRNCNKFTKIPIGASAGDYLFRHGNKHSIPHGSPHRNKGTEISPISENISKNKQSESQNLAILNRSTNVNDDVYTICKTESKTLPALDIPALGQGKSTRLDIGAHSRSSQSSTQVVDQSTQTVSRVDVNTQVSQSDFSLRCLEKRMGSHFGKDGSIRDMEHPGDEPPHKRAGIESDKTGIELLGDNNEGQNSGCVLGQHHSTVLCKEAGRHKVLSSLSRDLESVDLGREDGSPHSDSVHKGQGQCSGRSAEQRKHSTAHRVDTSSRSMSDHLGDTRATRDRSVCHKEKHKTAKVLFPRHGQRSSSHGRTATGLEQPVSLRISPHSLHKGGDKQISSHKKGKDVTDSPLVASKKVVSGPVSVVGGNAETPSDKKGPVASTSRRNLPSTNKSSEIVRLDFVQQSIRSSGFSQQVAEMAAGCHKKSTSEVYQAKWKLYREWCGGHGVSATNPSVINLADFFVHLYSVKKLSPSAIKGYRSMLVSSLKHKGVEITSNPTIQDIFRAIEIKAPRIDRSLVSWNLNVVLQYLMGAPFEPLAQASLFNVMRKALFLMILATSKRVGEAQAYSHDVGYKGRDMILSYLPEFRAKTESERNKLPRFVQIPSLDNILNREDKDRLNCPVRALKYYLDKVKNVANRPRNLFCSIKESSRPASKNGMSYMVRMLIKEAHKELDEKWFPMCKVKTHDVRGVGTSIRFNHNRSMAGILEAGTWKCDNVFINHYLKEVAIDYGNCRRLGPFVAGGAIIEF